jgi:hypothetical protein
MDRTPDALEALLLDPFLTVCEAAREADAVRTASADRTPSRRPPRGEGRPLLAPPAPVPFGRPGRPALML